jgi:hypothetical protein
VAACLVLADAENRDLPDLGSEPPRADVQRLVPRRSRRNRNSDPPFCGRLPYCTSAPILIAISGIDLHFDIYPSGGVPCCDYQQIVASA